MPGFRPFLLAMALLAAATAPLAEEAGPTAPAQPKRVILIHSFGRQYEPFSSAAASFRTELALHSPGPVEFYDMLLETARFSEGDFDVPQAEYLRMLRERKAPDLVVPVGAPAFRFCQRHRDLFAGVPLLVAAMEKRHLDGVDLGPDATAVTFDLNFPAFIEDILRLLPATRHVGVVIGDSPIERFWAGELKREARAFDGRVTFTWLNEVSFAEACRRAAHMPAQSVLLFAMMDIDATGVPYEQQVALKNLRASANVPVFGFFEEQMGNGVVGGRLIPAHELGAESARVAGRILKGERAGSIPAASVPAAVPVYDWRELEHWGIPESLLPPGSEIRFRKPSFWAAYRWYIAAISAFIALESILIAMLLANWRRLRSAVTERREAVAEAQDLRRELTHSGRVSLMGQLVASLSHELGQPLGAILRNADAAEIYLKAENPDLDEIRAIVADIRRDDERAAAVIARMRSLLRRRAIEMQPQDFGQRVDELLMIVGADAEARHIAIDTEIPADLPMLRGDRVHLQQVLINLVVNAMDSIDAAKGERRVVIGARAEGADGWVEASVRDTGEGIPSDRMGAIFNPFFSSRNDGMGMGLPISKTIVEAHGGRIWVENHRAGGAVFHFTIPTAEGKLA